MNCLLNTEICLCFIFLEFLLMLPRLMTIRIIFHDLLSTRRKNHVTKVLRGKSCLCGQGLVVALQDLVWYLRISVDITTLEKYEQAGVTVNYYIF